ncbi:MAG: uroporphyrinogen decarboxylase family protein [Dehalococcoidia bacterium]|jgi:uroporphyrinogen decarboxylase
MHKDDLMTPKERATALAQGRGVDRLQIMLFYGPPSPALLGWTGQQAGASARNIAAVQKATYEAFGCDLVYVGYSMRQMAVAFGGELSQEINVPPSILKPPVKSIDDLSVLDLEKMTLEKDPALQKGYEAGHILQDELGDEVDCGMGMSGVFTLASGLVGVPQLLRAMLLKPERVHRLMEFVTAAIIQLLEPFAKEGFAVWISDPVASNSLISKDQFREFVLPYTIRFVERLRSIKPLPMVCHICGDTSLILDDIVACGFDVFSLDNKVDMAFAKEKIGSQIHLLGNVDPVILYDGTPEEVKTAVRECCRKAWDSPRGYTVGTGCDTAYGTPLENALAFMEEARKCVKYPIQPENFK